MKISVRIETDTNVYTSPDFDYGGTVEGFSDKFRSQIGDAIASNVALQFETLGGDWVIVPARSLKSMTFRELPDD
jgi:hypothetical protein